jgi:hypothetical protein
VNKQPHDDDPTFTDGKVIDGEVIDGTIVDGDVVDGQLVDDDLTERLAALSLELDEHPAQLDERMTATLHGIASEAGEPSPELAEAALADAGRLRRRRYAVTAVAALAALGLSGTAVAASSWGSDQQADRLVASAPVQASPSASDPSPEVLPAEAVAPSPVASPSASASAAPEAAPAPAPARPGGAAAPERPAAAAPLAVRFVSASNNAPVDGDTVTYRVSWSDGDGRFFGTEATWGSNGSATSGGAVDRCSEVPSKRAGTATFRHTWSKPGPHRVRLTVLTYDCASGGDLEKKSAVVTVVVKARPSPPPPPSQEPTTTPEPTPSETSPAPTA